MDNPMRIAFSFPILKRMCPEFVRRCLHTAAIAPAERAVLEECPCQTGVVM